MSLWVKSEGPPTWHIYDASVGDEASQFWPVMCNTEILVDDLIAAKEDKSMEEYRQPSDVVCEACLIERARRQMDNLT